MVIWNKLIYYLNGLWTALPMASPYERYSYALRNRVDLFILKLTAAPLIPPWLTLPGLFLISTKSETASYKVAFYRIIDNRNPRTGD